MNTKARVESNRNSRHSSNRRRHNKGKRDKFDQDRIRQLAIHTLRSAPENSQLYRPIDPSDPANIALADSIRKNGVLEPLVVTTDRVILSGHRRLSAAAAAGRKRVPCRIELISWKDDPQGFVAKLREFNHQRVKDHGELLREEIISANPDEAYTALIEERRDRAALNGDGAMELGIRKDRPKISDAKMPLLNAVIAALNELKDYLPVSVRKIHYQLLNDPPLIHASKPGSRYANDKASYRAVVDICTRARLVGIIRWGAISDKTRPMINWNVYANFQNFARDQLGGFMKGYWRDLLQSQPNHIELIVEADTLLPVVRPIAEKFCLPVMAGRGFSSLPPRRTIAQRYEKSGKEELILLIISDFDPSGEVIAQSFARSMRDDFYLDVHARKVALTYEQTQEMDLPPSIDPKPGSSTYDDFVEKYGEAAWEVEAIPPDTLQELLEDAIDDVLDHDAFNAEIDAEKHDAVHLQALRKQVNAALKGMDFQQGSTL